jgi:hypothetical protein
MIVVVLTMSIIMSVVVTIIRAIIAMISPVVVTPVVAVIATVVVTCHRSGSRGDNHVDPAVTVISSIRSTVTIVEALTTVAVVVAVAPGLLGGRRDSKGTLQLLALPHGVLGITVELALVVHDHIEVTFEEGGKSWWIYYIGFTRSLVQPGASIVVVFSVEVMHYRSFSVDQFFDVGHEVTNGFCVGFMEHLKQLDVGDSLL